MPQYADGTHVHEDEWTRLLQSIPVSYRVWKDGSTYRAECNLTGGSDYESSRFETVLQNAVDACQGGAISIGELDVTVESSIEYVSNTRFQGLGRNKTVLRWGEADYLFKPKSVGALNYHVQWNDLNLIVTSDTAGIGCILVDGCIQSTLDNVYMQNTSGTKTNPVGVKLYDSGQIGCYFNQIRNCEVGGYAKGIHFGPAVGGWTANNNLVMGGRYRSNTTGIHIEAGTVNWLVNPDLEGNTTAIDVDESLNGIVGGYFQGCTTDIDVKASESFTAFGPRRDLTNTVSGTLAMIGSGYGNNTINLIGIPTGAGYTLLRDGAGNTYAAPDTTYINYGTAFATKIEFTYWQPKQARLVVSAQGDEAGVGKGLRVYDATSSAEVCKYEWDGNGLQQEEAGSWATYTFTGDKKLRLQVKGSSATEDITTYFAEVQFK